MRKLFFSLAVVALTVGLATGFGSTSHAAAATKATPSTMRIQAQKVERTTSNPCAQNFGCNPPLIWNGGPIMGTASTGPIVVTPIYWEPKGHPIPATYSKLLNQYLKDVSHDSGTHSNVYAVPNEYTGSNGQYSYNITVGKAITDKDPLPTTDSCTVGADDTTNIYADGSGYDACVSDLNIQTETEAVITKNQLPVDLAHIYVMYLPKHVESCFNSGDSTDPNNNVCTINHYPTAGYCAYHFITQDSTSAVYANMPFPIYNSPVGYTCGSTSQANFGTVESLNKNPDADTEISPTSHELIEAFTDPDTSTGYYDANGLEIGDECAYVYGPTAGSLGHLWNQTINHHHYLTQEEFSNADYNATHRGCRPTEVGF